MGQITKQIKGKIIFKHQTAADWELSAYVPDEGEQVFYDPDENNKLTRVKVGDGEKAVKDLPFIGISEVVKETTIYNKEFATYESDSVTLNGVYKFTVTGIEDESYAEFRLTWNGGETAEDLSIGTTTLEIYDDVNIWNQGPTAQIKIVSKSNMNSLTLTDVSGYSDTNIMTQRAITNTIANAIDEAKTEIKKKDIYTQTIVLEAQKDDNQSLADPPCQLIAGEEYTVRWKAGDHGTSGSVYLIKNGETSIVGEFDSENGGEYHFIAEEGVAYAVDISYSNIVRVYGPIVIETPIKNLYLYDELGSNGLAVMSQKAITEKFVGSKLSDKEIPEDLYNELMEEVGTDLNHCHYYGVIPAGTKLKLTLFYTPNENYSDEEDYNPWRTRGLIIPEGLPHNGETVIVEANGEEVVIYDTREYYSGETSHELSIAGVEERIDILVDKVKDESVKCDLKFNQIDNQFSSLWTKKDEWIFVNNIDEEIKLGGTFISTATFGEGGGSISYEITDTAQAEYYSIVVYGYGFERSEELTLAPNPDRIIHCSESVGTIIDSGSFYRKNEVNLTNGNGINITKENDNLEISVDTDYIKTIEVNNAVSAQSAQSAKSAESVKWTSVQVRPAINQGNVATAIVINEGSSSGKYSIAGGTNDKDIITEMVGSTIANGITVNVPTATADAAISFGTGTEVNTIGGIALGAMTVAGVKGYYWDEIDFNAKTITITSERRASKNSTPAAADISDWAIGDVISLVNEQNYPAFAKITNKVGNKITVDNIPFTEIKYTPVPILGTYTYSVPQARTIFACYKKTEYSLLGSVQNYRWYSRSGSVSLGWAAIATGAENLAAGAGSFVTGFNNFAAGSFGLVTGRENIGSYAGIVGGYGNNVSGNFSLVGGRDNIVTGLSNLVCGSGHTVKGTLGLAVGSDCETAAGGAYVGGYHSKSLHNNSHVHGLYLESGAAAQTVIGRYNEVLNDALFIIGNGSSETPSNIFEVRSSEAKVKGSLLADSLTSGSLSASSATITGYTTINGVVTVNNNIVVTGRTNTGSLIVQGSSDLAGDTSMSTATVSGTLTVGDKFSTNTIDSKDAAFIQLTKTAVIGNNIHSFSGNSLALGTSNELSGTGDNNASCNNMYVGGYSNTVKHNNAHVHGQGLMSTRAAQTVVGVFNDETNHTDALFVVGAGSASEKRNVFTVGSKIYANVPATFKDNLLYNANVLNGTAKFGTSADGLVKCSTSNSIIGGLDNQAGYVDSSNKVVCGNNMYAGGYANIVAHNNAHVHGRGLQSTVAAQTVVGTFNSLTDSSKNSIFVVGVGSNEDNRKNAFEVGKDYVNILGTTYRDGDIVTTELLGEVLSQIGDFSLEGIEATSGSVTIHPYVSTMIGGAGTIYVGTESYPSAQIGMIGYTPLVSINGDALVVKDQNVIIKNLTANDVSKLSIDTPTYITLDDLRKGGTYTIRVFKGIEDPGEGYILYSYQYYLAIEGPNGIRVLVDIDEIDSSEDNFKDPYKDFVITINPLTDTETFTQRGYGRIVKFEKTEFSNTSDKIKFFGINFSANEIATLKDSCNKIAYQSSISDGDTCELESGFYVASIVEASAGAVATTPVFYVNNGNGSEEYEIYKETLVYGEITIIDGYDANGNRCIKFNTTNSDGYFTVQILKLS